MEINIEQTYSSGDHSNQRPIITKNTQKQHILVYSNNNNQALCH